MIFLFFFSAIPLGLSAMLEIRILISVLFINLNKGIEECPTKVTRASVSNKSHERSTFPTVNPRIIGKGIFHRFLKQQGNIKCKAMHIKTKSDRRWSNFRFQWTKICTRVILNIFQSFLHFFKAKYINNCLK